MRPIILQGHERPLTQIKYNHDGDLLFSCAKDKVINVWFSHNGERLGTYEGHTGAIWTCDISKNSALMVSGAADNTMRLWDVKTGKQLFKWEFPTAVKRVEFNEDDSRILAVTEQRMGFSGTVTVVRVPSFENDVAAETPLYVITTRESKATVAGWSYLSKYLITGHDDGSVSRYDAKTGDYLESKQVHNPGASITDLQFSVDRTYFVTACKDTTAKAIDVESFEVIKTYLTDTPLNTSSITPVQDFVVVGGGQEARDVTTTASRQGKFETRFYHAILEEELGRVKGHFGPINTIAVHPKGTGYASGGEDGYVRVHAFDKNYFDFKYTL
ncbi:translation initiation factor eIF3i [Schizosaccharomyces cryophilus OY26]|uniref:Eukaryotic translation initiation factor 3 subunit I n=1 Tax=Schizosaccharomyces cryophilus (strain OY26 / ATCC MYA-4695 / CBS 11777 / NBRC 106824 / NRRL Y48691) TaxID=653667 RepID=S9W5F4_SCHCR|nr:translation initiation factor eIF3i [Schizosaccharomyces cryophilus OY26]EPY53170.1 translation initiation factor eIF3i [Schizosaccharomyces cryophilus OY26]